MEGTDKYLLLKFQAGYDLLLAQVKHLRFELENLKKENIALKDKLSINSSNSSLPPSSDFKKVKKEKKPTGRNRGGQIGHKGRARELVDTNKVNFVEQVLPQDTCECGGKVVVDRSTSPWRHQKIELPKIMPEITEYQMYLGRCNCCKAEYRAELPSGVGHNMLGPRAMSFLAQISSTYNVTRKKTQKLFKEWFGINISLGCISESEGRVSEYVEECYNALEAALKKRDRLNADETSHKESGVKKFAWIFTNKEMTYLTIESGRGKKILKNLFVKVKT